MRAWYETRGANRPSAPPPPVTALDCDTPPSCSPAGATAGCRPPPVYSLDNCKPPNIWKVLNLPNVLQSCLMKLHWPNPKKFMPAASILSRLCRRSLQWQRGRGCSRSSLSSSQVLSKNNEYEQTLHRLLRPLTIIWSQCSSLSSHIGFGSNKASNWQIVAHL